MEVDNPKTVVHQQDNQVQPVVEDILHNGLEVAKSSSHSIPASDVCTQDETPQNETSGEDHTDIDDDDSKDEDSEVKNGEFQFQTKSIHIIKTRQGKKQYKCDVCTGVYQHAFSLKRHFLRTHINYKFLSEADVTNCNINLSLVRKLKAEDDSKKCVGLYRCHICGRLFDTRDELKSHDSSHPDSNSQKGFSCDQCEMTFPQRQNLVRHQSVHLGEKRFTCKHCPRSFPSLNNQRKHEKTHETGNTSYLCRVCSMSFAENANLRRHYQKAHQDKFHPCGSCSKFFTQREKLLKHTQVHHAVSAGGLSAKKQKPSPKGHIVFKKKKGKSFEPHSEYKYTCSVCKRKFATYVNMCRHKKAMHVTPQQEKRTRPPHLRKETSKSKVGKAVTKEMSEEEFYMTIAHRISENLLYYLDGKSSQLNTKRDPSAFPEEAGSKEDLHWSIYNFPAAFDITQMMQIYSNRIPSHNALSNDGSDNSDETECIFTDTVQQSAPQKASSKQVECSSPGALPRIFVCSVCTEKFYSYQTIEDHKVNNHPNVVCTHVELEGQKDVPPELCWMLRGPVGALQRSSPPLTNEKENLKCTKCDSSFTSRVDLHQHILECGADSGFEQGLAKCSGYPRRFGSHRWRSGSIPSYFRGRKRHLSESRPRIKSLAKKQKDEVDHKESEEPNMKAFDESKEDEIQVQIDLADEKDIVIEDGAYEVVDNTEEYGYEDSINEGVSIKDDNAGEIEEAIDDDASTYADVHSETDRIGHQVETGMCQGTKKKVNSSSESSSDALLVHDYLHVSSPGEPVGNDCDEHHSECAAEDKDATHTPMAPSSMSNSYPNLDIVVKEETVVEERASTGNTTVSKPEGRVLRSKTAAASAASASFHAAKSHTCSTCKRKFAYLASLKKHLQDICPNKKVAGEKTTKRRGRAKVLKDHDLESSLQKSGQSCELSEVDGTRLLEAKDGECSAGSCDAVCDRLGDIDLFPDDKSVELPLNAETADGGDSDIPDQSQESVEEKVSPSAAKVKQEDSCADVEDGDKVKSKVLRQEHCCPYCLHSFAYLSNFRKHIREVCLLKKKAMQAGSEGMKMAKLRSTSKYATSEPPCRSKRSEAASSAVLNFKGNIENSVINLLRNQSKQMEIIGTPGTTKEQGGSPTSASFMTFSCPVCHKIFLSYVKMLQHRLSHKLQTDDSVKEDQNEHTLLNGGEEASADDRKTDMLAVSEKSSQEPSEVVKVKSEEERFDEILMTLRNQGDQATNEGPVTKKECGTNDDVICLAELGDLPDEDDKVMEEKKAGDKVFGKEEKGREMVKEKEGGGYVEAKEGSSEVGKQEEDGTAQKTVKTKKESAGKETKVEAVLPVKKNIPRKSSVARKKCVAKDKVTLRRREKKPPARLNNPKDNL